jgi:hypothetical protein
MKLHEVIIKLVNNRDKGLMFKDATGRIATLETGEFCVRFKGEKSIIDVDEDWEEIKQPVPWQEAIAAWAKGKTIWCEYHDETRTYSKDISKDQNGQMMNRLEIKNGTWYIED